MTPVLAHAGDWIVTIIIVAPLTAFFVVLGIRGLRDRRRGRRPQAGAAPTGASDSTSPS